jgi:SAM-dependent methyltransferase
MMMQEAPMRLMDDNHQHHGHAGRTDGAPAGSNEGEPLPSPVDYDTELRLHNGVFSRALPIGPDDRVLDIGCGTGQTTRAAARRAPRGSSLGVDISAPMIERARELSQAQGLSNVTFERADAQVHPFPSEQFDIAISRFGTMFFHDLVAAFANIGRALRPCGRLVMMVWQNHDDNEWSTSIQRALGSDEGGPLPVPPTLDPFSLSDPATVEAILDAARFADVTFTDVHQPVYYGRDIAAALDWIRGFSCTNDALKRLDSASAERAIQRLRESLAAHASRDGVWFDSRSWIVKAVRRQST